MRQSGSMWTMMTFRFWLPAQARARLRHRVLLPTPSLGPVNTSTRLGSLASRPVSVPVVTSAIGGPLYFTISIVMKRKSEDCVSTMLEVVKSSPSSGIRPM